jgi:hypothetical protein
MVASRGSRNGLAVCQGCAQDLIAIGWTSDYKSTPDDPYNVQIGGVLADPYLIVQAYGITDMPIAQAIKKLLRCGRKHKTKAQDVEEAITSLQRWKELNQ